MHWIVGQNRDETEATLCLKSHWERSSKNDGILHKDNDGNPLIVIAEFNAESISEANIIYHYVLGHEPIDEDDYDY